MTRSPLRAVDRLFRAAFWHGQPVPGVTIADPRSAARIAALPGTRRVRVDLSAGLVGLRAARGAGTMAGILVLMPFAALAQEATMVAVDTIPGLVRAVLRPDGSVELVFDGGAQVVVPAQSVEIGPGGEIRISVDALDAATEALAVAAPALAPGVAATLGAAGIGAAAGGGSDPAPVTGHVVDGYVVDALVFRDIDGDGIWDSGLEPAQRTGPDGSFNLAALAGSGPLVAQGGHDLATGLPMRITLTAPDGATVITPLTTLVEALTSGGGLSATAAESALRTALDLGPGSLLGRDPAAEAEAGATGALAAAARIANLFAVAEAAGADPGAVAAALAQAIAAGNGAAPGDAEVLAAALRAGLPAGTTVPVDALAGLLAGAAASMGVDAASIEAAQAAIMGDLVRMIDAGTALPADFAALAAGGAGTLTPVLTGFDGVVTAAENAAGVDIAGRGLPGSDVTLTLGPLRTTVRVGVDGTWTARFEPGALTTEGAVTLTAVAVADRDGLTLTSRALTQTVAVDLAPATIGGDIGGSVTEDAGARLFASGRLTLADSGPLPPAFLPQTVAGAEGTFALDAAGNWSYAAATDRPAIQALGAGETLVERFTAVAMDGTEQVVTITILGTNDTAVIGGETAGETVIGLGPAAAGSLTVADVDAGEAAFAPLDVTGAHGRFTLSADGGWTYVPDPGSLSPGSRVQEVFTIATADGTTAAVTMGLHRPVSLAEVREGTGGTAITGLLPSIIDTLLVRGAGDLNGDGLDDVVIGAPFVSSQRGWEPNRAYAAYSRTDGNISAADLEAGIGGFVLFRPDGSRYVNFSISIDGLGDVNGDGIPDFVVGLNGTSGALHNAGPAALVLFGRADGAAPDLANLEDGNGFAIDGNRHVSPHHLSAAGDVNGDGLADLVIGIGDGRSSQTAHVVFGRAATDPVALADVAAGDGGFAVTGLSLGVNERSGLAGGGDVNGDGYDDIVATDVEGRAVVVFGGPAATTVDSSAITGGTGGFTIGPENGSTLAARIVSIVGDVNGDGRDDIAVWAHDTPLSFRENWVWTGFVVFGQDEPVDVTFADLADGIGGFALHSFSGVETGGLPIAGAGDVNGDGRDDIVIGAPLGRVGFDGAYVVFGKDDVAPVTEAAIRAGQGGFLILGESPAAFMWFGYTVDAAGDVNGDGFADILVGNSDLWEPVSLHIVHGGNFTGAVDHVGGSGDDSIEGTAAAEGFTGGLGDDTVLGGGGADVIYGGAGDDVLAVADLGFARIDGGTGTDVLRLAAADLALDLTGPGDALISSIERIDLGGLGNTLKLSGLDLLRLSESGNTLRVTGGAADRVDLTADVWAAAGSVTDAEGQFEVFTAGAARLEIADGITRLGGPVPRIDLAEVEAGRGGFAIFGLPTSYFFGHMVDGAGDVNGDGIPDLVIGSADPFSGQISGPSVVYLLHGSRDGSAIDVADIGDSRGGFVLSESGTFTGLELAGAGDINGDGFDDVIIGKEYDWNDADRDIWVVFGSRDAVSPTPEGLRAGEGGFAITGGDGQNGGRDLAALGDVNGDGFEDVAVVEFSTHGAGRFYPATAHVIFGRVDIGATRLSDIAADNESGIVIRGFNSDLYRHQGITGAGDFNGDGYDDILVSSAGEGRAHVVPGGPSLSDIDLATPDGPGLAIRGTDHFFAVSNVGDVNGDGRGDLIVQALDNPLDAGRNYVIFGTSDPSDIDLADIAAGQGGFVLDGFRTLSGGKSLAGIGDVNGDGLDDFALGHHFGHGAGQFSGTVHVIFGKTDGESVLRSEIDAGRGGFLITGASAGDEAGYSIAAAGDVNGDGFADFAIGGWFADGENSGAHVVHGGNFTGAVDHVGTAGDDSITGTAGDEVIFTGFGDDLLSGGGGVDRLSGGAGADLFVIPDLPGQVTIADFTPSEGDRIDLSAFGFTDLAAVLPLVAPEGPAGRDMRITLSDDLSLLVQDFAPGQLREDHLQLVPTV